MVKKAGFRPRASGEISPLAPEKIAQLPPLAGVRLATGSAGVRYRGRVDVLLAELAPGTQVAGVFTRSMTPSAPVEWCKANVKRGTARALVVNSGNANAFTGKSGVEGVRRIAKTAAQLARCKQQDVLLASTGVIGEPLPSGKIAAIVPRLFERLREDAWRPAAEAIMTTDTFPKLATATASIDGVKVRINGFAKGSGMIAPDMATMLAFVFTDASISSRALQATLSEGVRSSFNAITVDSDTSTSDTLLLFATGRGRKHAPIRRADDRRLADFRRKLDGLLLDLALQVVSDGEGAKKLIRVDVEGARSDAAAKRIALSIANSPLVKTAIAGGDANWGRVVMAVGKSGEAVDRDRLKIRFAGHLVAENGERSSNCDEAKAARAMAGRTVQISVGIGLGRGRARVWTCDLTHGYIDINGSYRS